MAKKKSKKGGRSKSIPKAPSKKKKMSKSQLAKAKNKAALETFEYDFGKTTFVFGVLLSIIVGVILGNMSDAKLTTGIGLIYSVIFVMGLIVGLLNITVKEINEFLIASITFLVAAGINLYVLQMTLPKVGAVIQQIYFSLGIFVAPAATIVALKAMYELAKNK